MIILHHPPQNASVGRHSCRFQIWGYPAKITGKDNPRRPWHIPRPYNIGPKRPTCQSLMNCTFWQDVFMSWGGPWGLLPPSLMELSLKEPHLSREPWRKGWPNQVQWRPHEPLCWNGNLLPHQISQPLCWLRSQMSWLLHQESQPLHWPGSWLPHLLHQRQTRRWRSHWHVNSPAGKKYTHLGPETPVGQVPSSLGNVRWCHQSCSSSRRSAQHHRMEEQRNSGQGDSSSTLLCKSPMPNPSLEDAPKLLPPDFREISQSLIKSQPQQVTIEAPQELMPLNLLGGPAMDHVDINKDKLRWGNQHHIHEHNDSLNGASSLGDFSHGSWPQNTYAGGCHRCHQCTKGGRSPQVGTFVASSPRRT